MAESEVTPNLQATALAALLESSRAPHPLAAYHGALTPRQLDAPEVETEALAFGAALHDLGWLRRVDVRGADRFRWLSGMVTNTVNDLFPNTGAWNLVLDAQGHIQGDLTVWRGGEEPSPKRRSPVNAAKERKRRTEDKLLGTPFAGESGLELEIAADQMDKLLAHLNKFIVMDDVELVALGDEQVGEAGSETAVGLTGPMAPEVLERVGLPVLVTAMTGTSVDWNGWEVRIMRGYGVLAPHYEFWLPSAGLAKLWSHLRTGGATPVGAAALEAFRIAEGIPAYGDRHGGARPAAGDGADAGAALQQGLLPGPGDCRAHPVAGQRAPASAAAGAGRAGAGGRHGIDAGGRDGCRERLPARPSCR